MMTPSPPAAGKRTLPGGTLASPWICASRVRLPSAGPCRWLCVSLTYEASQNAFRPGDPPTFPTPSRMRGTTSINNWFQYHVCESHLQSASSTRRKQRTISISWESSYLSTKFVSRELVTVFVKMYPVFPAWLQTTVNK